MKLVFFCLKKRKSTFFCIARGFYCTLLMSTTHPSMHFECVKIMCKLFPADINRSTLKAGINFPHDCDSLEWFLELDCREFSAVRKRSLSEWQFWAVCDCAKWSVESANLFEKEMCLRLWLTAQRRTMVGASPQFQLASFINFSNLNFCHLNVHNRRRGARPPLWVCVLSISAP